MKLLSEKNPQLIDSSKGKTALCFRLKQSKYLISLFLILTLLSLSLPVHATETQASLDQLIAEQAALEEEWQYAKNRLAAFEDEKAMQESNMAWLLGRSDEQRALYEEQLKQVAAITRIKQSLQRNLEVSMRKFEQRKALYAERIEGMYNLQKKSQLELLLESDSLESYFTKLRLMKLITDADEQDLQAMREERDRLIKQKEETSKHLEQVNEVLQNIEADMNAVEQDLVNYQSQVANMDYEMQALYSSIEGYTDRHFDLQIEIDETNRQLEYEAYVEQLNTSNTYAATDATAIQYTGSGFIWPCPGSDGISSYFGYRNIPEAGINDFHTGVDFAAGFDVPCLAAAAGTVVYAGWMQYGGNTVQVDIGGGLTIMYCHLNGFNVSQGQYVNQGEVVGFVGSTGNSTGPHLHFEVQVGGDPVDPMLYLG